MGVRRRRKTISVNARDDIGTLLVGSLLTEHGISLSQVHFDNNVAFPTVGASSREEGSTRRSPPSRS